MALDVVSNILLSVKADTKDAKRKLRDLSGAEKKAAKEFIEGQERRNSSLERQVAFLGKVTLAVGSVGAALAAANAAQQHFAERARLTYAAAGADIDKMQDAARGLVSEMDALRIAAALQNGAFQISERQMQTVFRAMVALRNEGNDFAEVQREVTKAIVEGNVEGLKKFGIALKASAGTVEGFNAIMEVMKEKADSAAASVELAGDEAERARVSFRDFWDEVASGAGRAADATVNAVAQIVNAIRSSEDLLELLGLGDQADRESAASSLRFRRRANARTASRQEDARRFQELSDDVARRAAFHAWDIGDFAGRFASAWEKSGEEVAKRDRKNRDRNTDRIVKAASGVPESLYRPGDGTGAGTGIGSSSGFALEELGSFAETSVVDLVRSGVMEQARKEMEAIRLEADLMAEGLTVAFSAFEGAATSAFQAFIEGSASAKEIARRFVGDLLSGLATQMFSRSLFHAAEALALLIPGPTFNPAGAALAGKTAAAYAGGAAVVGSLARAWGTSAPSGGAGSSAGGLPAAAAAAQGASGPGSTSQTFIVNSNPFDDNPREARRRLSRAFDRAREERGGTGTAVIRG